MVCPAGSVSQYVAALQGLVGPVECTDWYANRKTYIDLLGFVRLYFLAFLFFCEFLSFHSPVGANMPLVNQATCLSCDVGFFSNETGSVICRACQPGYFQNIAGKDTWLVFKHCLAFCTVTATLF